MVLGRAVDDGVAAEVVLDHVGRHAADVQEAEMRGVDVALERLQPVAFALDEEHVALVLGQQDRLEARQRRRRLALAHVGPDQAVALEHLVALRLDPLGERLVGGNVRHVDAVAVDVELPAVVGAADALVLVAPEEQRRAAVRAAMIEDADPAARCRERR